MHAGFDYRGHRHRATPENPQYEIQSDKMSTSPRTAARCAQRIPWMPTVYTVGHSNHSLADFLALLAQVDVQCLVDIRKLTGLCAQPQFNADALAAALAAGRGLSAFGGAGRPARTQPRNGQPAQWLVEQRQLSPLCGLRQHAGVCRGPAAAADAERAKRCALMCAEGRLVALPSAHRRRPPARARLPGAAHHGTWQGGARAPGAGAVVDGATAGCRVGLTPAAVRKGCFCVHAVLASARGLRKACRNRIRWRYATRTPNRMPGGCDPSH